MALRAGAKLSSFAKIFARSYQVGSTTRKTIPVYPAIEKECKSNLLKQLSEKDLNDSLDPQKWRRELISTHNKDRLRAGDVVRVAYNSQKCKYDNLMGYVLSVDRKVLTQDASILLRNQYAKTFVEVRVPIFSPLIDRIDLIRRADGRRQRGKHYYIRNTKLDVGDLEAGMRKRR
ncbi:LANO_0A02058g1_1 [Lachancea nothofagi CBS 11611]|uniref:LANO_0A02058g1_1 n=1 Tax=Lachancea nothofagi CBS 11611 TaxID=1266666 RepID=A0A1G4IN48_9SACH|nr:LANO_0A02058g1_1 [Lachancea nothofagi CBS 11611]